MMLKQQAPLRTGRPANRRAPGGGGGSRRQRAERGPLLPAAGLAFTSAQTGRRQLRRTYVVRPVFLLGVRFFVLVRLVVVFLAVVFLAVVFLAVIFLAVVFPRFGGAAFRLQAVAIVW